ncbi:MAG: hypothetical protein PHU14_09030 [Methylovulum sp.]|nr:hypothetical protein [Methylovulum sp.]
MNKPSQNTITHSSLILALSVLICLPVHAESAAIAEQKATIAPTTMENCHAMQAQKQKMLDDMKVQDSELTEQLAKMNSAPDDKKVGMIAAVVTHMVEQRIAMDARKAKLEDMMMQHMQMGKDAMLQDPIPKEIGKK